MAIYKYAIGGNTFKCDSKQLRGFGDNGSNRNSTGSNLVQTCRQINAETNALPARLTTFAGDYHFFFDVFRKDDNMRGLMPNITSLAVTAIICIPPNDPLKTVLGDWKAVFQRKNIYTLLPSLRDVRIRIEYHNLPGVVCTWPQPAYPDACDLKVVALLEEKLTGLRRMLPEVQFRMDLVQGIIGYWQQWGQVLHVWK